MILMLKKEISLAMHPTMLIFLSFSVMLLIPNYPYFVTIFYTGLAVFFTCLTGRENNDVIYSIMLPVAKKDIVKGRIALIVLIQMAQLLVAIPFAIIRQSIALPGNQVGMDANITFFGFSLAMFGLFNYVFFGIYYKNINKVGKAFLVSSTFLFIGIVIAEGCTHAVPFVRDYLDTKDPNYLLYKVLTLGVGLLVYGILTSSIYMKSVKSFEELDL